MRMKRSFFNRDTLRVAEELLGKVLVHETSEGVLKGIISETEAYTQEDEATHTFRGRTKRNEVMFWSPGHLYVYFTYGMHYCCNIVTEDRERGCAVLIRAVVPLEGEEIMMRRRNGRDLKGPAKVCQAYGFDLEHNGIDLCESEHVYIEDGSSPSSVMRTPRIGISKATEKEWRFVADF